MSSSKILSKNFRKKSTGREQLLNSSNTDPVRENTKTKKNETLVNENTINAVLLSSSFSDKSEGKSSNIICASPPQRRRVEPVIYFHNSK
ncbi:hypothetical protein PoB_000769100 [Plakobranchus ocellatus]|uniref:Uncharacterized protein n=1 Tax=Plakobranchus ocellatus TaxID=259542 RepID=A0AAV3Y1S1_9GAST|nr:hypothetical protein PoB_000769100 [Plakobranchus ocellatus]